MDADANVTAAKREVDEDQNMAAVADSSPTTNTTTTSARTPVSSGDAHMDVDDAAPNVTETASFVPAKTGTVLVLFGAALITILSGTGSSIFTKWQNRTEAEPCSGCAKKYFEGPWLQSFLMFVGEMLCLIIYHVDRAFFVKGGGLGHFDYSTGSFSKPPCPFYWWAVPTVFDCIASTMANYATVYAQTSTVQMLRNFSVLVSCALRVLYIRVGLRVHQWLGAMIITVGLVVVGIYALQNPDTDTNHENLEWLGIILAIGCTVLTAFQFIFEESLFRKYTASPFVAVGWSGIFGMIITLIVMIIAEYADFEDVSGNLHMMTKTSKKGILWGSVVLYICAVCVFNGAGLLVTKLGSGVHRAVCFGVRTFTVWIVELCLKWNSFHGLNFAGLMILLFGAFVYNYNYFFTRDGWWAGDRLLKKGLWMCCGATDPDVYEGKVIVAASPSAKGEEAREEVTA